MDYLYRLDWIRIGKKTYRSHDGRFKIYKDTNMLDYDKPAWVLYDLIFSDYLAQTSFREARKAAQKIYDDDVKCGRILWS